MNCQRNSITYCLVANPQGRNPPELQKNIIYVAIGANLSSGDGCSPLQTCARAIGAILALDTVSAGVRSRWFSTAPIPPSGQPRYINAVLRVVCTATPPALLAALAAIEQSFGRVRGAPDAARTLDLDIIDMGGRLRATPDPILPHPRAHLRAFVLYPLRDVAPHWVHPASGLGIDALIAALPWQDTTLL
jgi:2-amino-4-hydroxy-6-hydroxymethyldihydropteridine diphosphokinase